MLSILLLMGIFLTLQSLSKLTFGAKMDNAKTQQAELLYNNLAELQDEESNEAFKKKTFSALLEGAMEIMEVDPKGFGLYPAHSLLDFNIVKRIASLAEYKERERETIDSMIRRVTDAASFKGEVPAEIRQYLDSRNHG